LAAENKVLRGQIDEAQRPAAPFRRRDAPKVPEAQRKQPGHPKGHPGVHHAVPTHVVEHVEVPLPACPHCGGAVEGVEPIEPREVVGREAESVQGSWHQPGRRAGTIQVARG